MLCLSATSNTDQSYNREGDACNHHPHSLIGGGACEELGNGRGERIGFGDSKAGEHNTNHEENDGYGFIHKASRIRS